MMLFLGFVNVMDDLPRVKSVPLDEKLYYSTGNDKLKGIPCPVCNSLGGLFTGFFWIGCHNCLNLYLTPDELSKELIWRD